MQNTLSTLAKHICKHLQGTPNGLSEQALLKHLIEEDPELLPVPPGETGTPFRTHFLLYHALYALRDQLWEKRMATLSISPFQIQLLPYNEAEHEQHRDDPLRNYYLNLENLEHSTQINIGKLMSTFYSQLKGDDTPE